ncbi:hypothetical protein Agub_g16031 [Astrephomene gubernaculifera]|uniref:Pherophorin domain-containing protein n=1 Tax=Astrephomene gubernaculifera TaxID=47775 RepID=A0AAD3HTI3_9CHLO|nr:hypothetical protein Agub_g16031 [Astrephomene gubernaculifera]
MQKLAIVALLCAIALFTQGAHARRALLQTSTGNTFPDYECQANPGLSPYKLEGAYTTSPSANGVRVCFTGAPVQPCPPSNPCCSQADFYKLELRVRPTCRRAIRSVTVNGLPAPVPTFTLYGPSRDKALFKLPRLNLTTANVTGAKICITLRDPCPNLAALCPEGDGSCTYSIGQSTGRHRCCPVNTLGVVPPPPSQPSASVATPATHRLLSSAAHVVSAQSEHHRLPGNTGVFPSNGCDRTPGSMPFTLTGAPTLSRSPSGQNLYCFTLASSACADPSSMCCASNLLKVEWSSYDTCRGSVRAYIDKIQYPVTWDQGGTFRLTKLNYSPLDIASKPKQLCIELRRDGPCDTIDKFCRGGSCTYSLFNTGKECCPTATTPTAR